MNVFFSIPIDFCFAFPRFLIATEEDFYCHILAVPHGLPDFTVAAFADAVQQCYLL